MAGDANLPTVMEFAGFNDRDMFTHLCDSVS